MVEWEKYFKTQKEKLKRIICFEHHIETYTQKHKTKLHQVINSVSHICALNCLHFQRWIRGLIPVRR